MSDPVYVQLCERLSRFESKIPQVESSLKVLEAIYSKAEAELATAFPEGSFTASELAGHFDKDVSQLTSLLETMADKGQLFVVRTADGGKKYELSPWMPGVMEFTVIRSMDTPKIKTLLDLTERISKEFKVLAEPFMEHPEALKAMLPEPHIRTLPIGESLPSRQVVHPHESVLEMVEKEESFAAARCCCRHMAEYRGDPCHVEGVPEYSCLSFGKVADFVVERNFGKRITKEECREILKTCAEKGLVHNSNNFIEGLQFICNCCPCCCLFLRLIKDMGNLNIIDASNFLSTVDGAACTGCGDCAALCPTKAITLKEDVASVDRKVCIGCGNCVAACPAGALTLRRVSDKKTGIGERKIGLGS
jgi:formate hydrogenlyase subunit 6/NADH:ubiquinone oxidoreductase subunit I